MTSLKKKEDYWSTPKEFLITGFGDCEDYAIIKYFTLIKLGFSKDKLFITTVNEKFTGGYHMVLSYFQNSGASPLILDNLSFRVSDLKTRNDLQADTFTNHSGVYKLNSKNKLIKIYDVSSQFQDLINRVKKEN